MQRRDAVLRAMKDHPIFQRRACVLIGIDPKTVRREPPPDNPEIRLETNKIAEKRRRFGYRRIGVMLERVDMVMNEKKLYHIYREEWLSVRRRRGRKRARGSRTPMPVPLRLRLQGQQQRWGWAEGVLHPRQSVHGQRAALHPVWNGCAPAPRCAPTHRGYGGYTRTRVGHGVGHGVGHIIPARLQLPEKCGVCSLAHPLQS